MYKRQLQNHVTINHIGTAYALLRLWSIREINGKEKARGKHRAYE